MQIKGTVIYLDFSGGFWGIQGADGQHFLPINMPAALKQKNINVKIKAKRVEDYMSINMWGTPIEIIGFDIV